MGRSLVMSQLFPSVNVHDTTGSGDAFVARLAYQLCRLGEPMSEMSFETLQSVMTFSNACGGLAATQVGAMSALPQLEDVERLFG